MSQRAIIRGHRRRNARGAALGTAAGVLAILAPSAQAADFTVDTLDDTAPDASPGACAVGTCTLREAIQDADANSETDVITFDSALSGDLDLALNSIYVEENEGVSIIDDGPNEVRIDAGGNSRIFTFREGDFSIEGVDLYNGSSYGSTSGGTEFGGLVQAAFGARVQIQDSTLSGSEAAGGGAISSKYGALVQLTDSTITQNAAEYGGGVLASYYGNVTTSGTTIADNVAFVGAGAMSSKYGFIGLGSSEVSGGYSYVGGGLANFLGRTTIDDTQVLDNNATVFAGGVHVKYGEVEVTDSTIDGSTARAGGNLVALLGDSPYLISSELLIDNSTISGGASSGGAGLLLGVYDSAEVSITDSTVSGNQAVDDPSYADGFGGGVLAFMPPGGDLTISNSTISGNSADAHGGGVALGYYGAPTTRESDFERLRPFADYRESGAEPKPLAAEDLTTPVLANTTVADNSAPLGAGVFAGYAKYSGSDPVPLEVSLSSTIVADSSGGGADLESETPSQFGLEYSLIEDPGSTTFTDLGSNLTGQDPALGALADNDGDTETHLPADTSPVVDQGIDNELGRDQRGGVRRLNLAPLNTPDDDPTDIGSVEVQGDEATDSGVRPLLQNEVPENCPVPFADADSALAGSGSGETISGTDGIDILRGFGGADTLIGKAASDCLIGDAGFDTIRGKGGSDWVDGGIGKDFIKGNGGDDELLGGSADDRLKGARGDDIVSGEDDDDNVSGGDGDDEISGGDGDDRIFGNKGNDDITGGPGNDVIRGGPGRDTINCGAGKDKVVINRRAADKVAKNCEIVRVRGKKS